MPDPEPLVTPTMPEPYPLDALPATIRAAVEEVLGFVQAPVALVTSSALGALSLAAQSLADVKRADKLTGPCSLFLLNILWDGGTLSVGRQTSDSFDVRGARLTVALQVQEATLRSFFEQSGALARGTGFLARFLIGWPESTQGHRPFRDPPKNWPALAAINDGMARLLGQAQPLTDDYTLEPPLLAFAPEAKAAWVAFQMRLKVTCVSAASFRTCAIAEGRRKDVELNPALLEGGRVMSLATLIRKDGLRIDDLVMTGDEVIRALEGHH